MNSTCDSSFGDAYWDAQRDTRRCVTRQQLAGRERNHSYWREALPPKVVLYYPYQSACDLRDHGGNPLPYSLVGIPHQRRLWQLDGQLWVGGVRPSVPERPP